MNEMAGLVCQRKQSRPLLSRSDGIRWPRAERRQRRLAKRPSWVPCVVDEVSNQFTGLGIVNLERTSLRMKNAWMI